MKLGIVGHAVEKFTPETEAKAKQVIDEAIAKYKPDHIISGRSPMGGIDIWAEEAALKHGIIPEIYPPKVAQWGAPGGYKDRNLKIAEQSDLVLCIVIKELPEHFDGMKFKSCYHCKGRNPDHVKSGGCWTAWKCKNQEWEII